MKNRGERKKRIFCVVGKWHVSASRVPIRWRCVCNVYAKRFTEKTEIIQRIEGMASSAERIAGTVSHHQVAEFISFVSLAAHASTISLEIYLFLFSFPHFLILIIFDGVRTPYAHTRPHAHMRALGLEWKKKWFLNKKPIWKVECEIRSLMRTNEDIAFVLSVCAVVGFVFFIMVFLCSARRSTASINVSYMKHDATRYWRCGSIWK